MCVLQVEFPKEYKENTVASTRQAHPFLVGTGRVDDFSFFDCSSPFVF